MKCRVNRIFQIFHPGSFSLLWKSPKSGLKYWIFPYFGISTLTSLEYEQIIHWLFSILLLCHFVRNSSVTVPLPLSTTPLFKNLQYTFSGKSLHNYPMALSGISIATDTTGKNQNTSYSPDFLFSCYGQNTILAPDLVFLFNIGKLLPMWHICLRGCWCGIMGPHGTLRWCNIIFLATLALTKRTDTTCGIRSDASSIVDPTSLSRTVTLPPNHHGIPHHHFHVPWNVATHRHVRKQNPQFF